MADGIHVDMEHLKKGEVKSVPILIYPNSCPEYAELKLIALEHQCKTSPPRLSLDAQR
jgi:hypothetical protein